MKLLLLILIALPLNAMAFSVMECDFFKGPTLLQNERADVDDHNQSEIHFNEVNGVKFEAYSLEYFVVIFATGAGFRVNTTGNMSSSLVVYGEQGKNEDLIVSCVLDPAE